MATTTRRRKEAVVPTERPGPVSPRRAAPRKVVVGALLLAAPWATAWAQASEQGNGPRSFSASLGASLLVSDNLDTAAGTQNRDGGVIATLTPGLNYRRDREGLRLSADYQLSLRESWRVVRGPKSVTNQLRSALQWANSTESLRLDASASVGQQNASAFGTQRADDRSLGLGSQGELYQLSLAPSMALRFGTAARFELSHRASVSNARNSILGDSRSSQTDAALRSGGGMLSTGLVLQSSRTLPKQGQSNRTDRALAELSWRPDVDWQLGAQGGGERSNLSGFGGLGSSPVASQRLRSGVTYGGSALWSPSPRTRLSVQGDHRVFGNTYSWSAEHRMAQSSLRVSQSRSVNLPGAVGGGGLTNYDLLFTQLASIQPDPVLRDALVRQLLAQQGLSPDGLVNTGFLSNRSSVSQTTSVGATWRTLRSTWLASASRAHSRPLGALPAGAPQDDFARSSEVLQHSASLSVGYRLTPESSLNAAVQWLKSQGNRADLMTDLRSLTLGWSTRLGRQQSLNLNLRHAAFESTLRPYDENAIQLSFLQQF